MPIFIADHTGTVDLQTRNLRPIHIGAALSNAETCGPEPDSTAVGSISSLPVFADLRLYHHVRHLYEGRGNYVAIMQYRRMFALGKPFFWQIPIHALHLAVGCQSGGEVSVNAGHRDLYLRHLSRLSDRHLRNEIGGADFVANQMDFGVYRQSVEEQYLEAIKILYPGQIEYIDAWYDMRAILERMTSQVVVANCFDLYRGYFNNCFVSSWESFLNYYDFIFEVLERLKQYLDVFRLFGYLAERAFGVYLMHSKSRVLGRSMLKFE